MFISSIDSDAVLHEAAKNQVPPADLSHEIVVQFVSETWGDGGWVGEGHNLLVPVVFIEDDGTPKVDDTQPVADYWVEYPDKIGDKYYSAYRVYDASGDSEILKGVYYTWQVPEEITLIYT